MSMSQAIAEIRHFQMPGVSTMLRHLQKIIMNLNAQIPENSIAIMTQIYIIAKILLV
jgi:hypothetical protein